MGKSRYCVCCLSCASWQSGYDIHDFCCRHLWCWWSLFCKYCIRSRITFPCRLEVQLGLCIFGALSPIRHSSNDRCPSVTKNELLCPSSLLHRSPLIYFWLLSGPTPESFQVSPMSFGFSIAHSCFSLSLTFLPNFVQSSGHKWSGLDVDCRLVSLSPDHIYPSGGFSSNRANWVKPVQETDKSLDPSIFQ